MSEVLVEKKSEAEIMASSVYDLMMEELQQEQLQLPGTRTSTMHEDFIDEWRDDLEADNPDKIVVDVSLVEDYRYLAAFFGAGFHISQYEEVTYQENEDAGELFYGAVRTSFHSPMIIPEYSRRHNRMRDEVSERLFAWLVPETQHHGATDTYITTEEDLKRIFQLDYEELQVWRGMGSDLLYERKD